MAAITWYATNSLVSVYQAMSESSPGANATASPVTGWIVGTTAPTVYSKFNSQVEQAAATFGATVEPDGSIDTTVGDCLRSENAYDGTFGTGNWTCTFACIAVTNGGSQDGKAAFRIFSGPNADGSGATERTTARQAGGAVTNLATSAQQSSSATFSVTGWTTSGAEYIFVQIGWQIDGAGGMTSADVDMRIGTTATLVTSANFTATPATLKSLSLTGVGT
jgi:hypothetical protein